MPLSFMPFSFMPISGLEQNELCLFPLCLFPFLLLSVYAPFRLCPVPFVPLSGLMENADYAGFLYAYFRARKYLKVFNSLVLYGAQSYIFVLFAVIRYKITLLWIRVEICGLVSTKHHSRETDDQNSTGENVQQDFKHGTRGHCCLRQNCQNCKTAYCVCRCSNNILCALFVVRGGSVIAITSPKYYILVEEKVRVEEKHGKGKKPEIPKSLESSEVAVQINFSIYLWQGGYGNQAVMKW
jgi:hypothetical protein